MDVASQEDKRGVFLDEVGVTGVKIPIRVLDRRGEILPEHKYQYTIGTFNAFVDLPNNQRGTHMSRLVEVIYKNRENINAQGLNLLTGDLIERLGA